MPCDFLGFEMDEVAMPSSPIVDLGLSADDDVPEQGQSDPPRAGGDVDVNCPLRVIRTACSTLGLSVRGSKKINLHGFQNFVKTQELMAAPSIETQLVSEAQREVHVQTNI